MLLCTIIAGFNSCKKSYTCTCNTTATGNAFGIPFTQPNVVEPVSYTDEMKKSEKDAWCEGYESTTQIPPEIGGLPVTLSVDCTVAEN